MVNIGPGSCRLPLNDVYLHVFDFNPHQKEIDFANYHILQMVPERQAGMCIITQNMCIFTCVLCIILYQNIQEA